MGEMHKHVLKHPQSRAAVIMVSAICQDNAQPMGRCVQDYGKNKCFREVCRSRRNTTVHNIEQELDQGNIEEDPIDMVNINLIIFNSKWLVITANLKTSSSQVSIIMLYK